jgi:ATP-binding cassette, subfamily B, multidrug efflux pump
MTDRPHGQNGGPPAGAARPGPVSGSAQAGADLGGRPPGMMGRGGPNMAMFMGKAPRAEDTRGTLFKLWRYLAHHRRNLIVTAILVVFSTGLNLLWPYLMGVAIDSSLQRGDLVELARVCGVMLVTFIFLSLLSWLQIYIMAGVAQETVAEIRRDLFGRVQLLPLRVFDQQAHGDLMSRLTNDVENINTVLSESITQLFSGVLMIVGVTIAMFWLNWMLALVTLLTMPPMVYLLLRVVVPRTRAGFRARQETLGELNGWIEESVSGQRVIAAYGRQAAALETFDDANQSYRRASTQALIYSGFIGPLNNFIYNTSLALIVAAGGALAAVGMATVGEIATFINYGRQFGRPLNELATLYNTIQAAIAGAERVFALMEEPSEFEDGAQASPTPALQEPFKGDVVLDDVSFSYVPGTPVLKHVSLHALPGQTVALVGPTGAGKTTIVNLLMRFYDVDGGAIRIDGGDIRELLKEDLRRQLGIVLQDTYLFTGTVMDNIRYGRLDATEDEVKAAARLANADQFIHRLPQGYDTPLSERGSNISQGQRQLLAIARAILADPAILVLDEATSSVDTRTEQNIQEAMLRLMSGRTAFVIAHRLSTIREADQILVLRHGEIVERGRHDELLDSHGFYAQLYASQFAHQGGVAAAATP